MTGPIESQGLAIIVPYRDRPEQLERFLSHMTNYLPGKVPGFSIWVIEQEARRDFNRGMLANIGFLEARSSCDYICIHDVDILPLAADLDYSFPECPRHIYGPERDSLGAIALFKNSDFENINGFSNSYWGWGREDVDLSSRVAARGLTVDRTSFRPRGAPEFLELAPDTLTQMNSERRKTREAWIDVWNRNYNVYRRRWRKPGGMERDGLNSCRYQVLDRQSEGTRPVHRLRCGLNKRRWWW